MSGYLWCALAGLASAVANWLIKLSNRGGAEWTFERFAFLGAAAGTYGLGFVLYSLALRRLDMGIAYPAMTAAAMALVAAIGFIALDEPLTMSKVAGMVLIAAGAFALSR